MTDMLGFKKVTVTPDMLKLHDRLVTDEKSYLTSSRSNLFPFEYVTKIEKDNEKQVYYVYIGHSSWYYCISFNQPIEIFALCNE